MDFLAPLLSADGITVQGINDRIAPGLLLRVTRRQKHEYVTVNGISLQVVFEGRSVNFDALHCYRLRFRNHRRRFGLNLRRKLRRERRCYHQRHYTKKCRVYHRCPFSQKIQRTSIQSCPKRGVEKNGEPAAVAAMLTIRIIESSLATDAGV